MVSDIEEGLRSWETLDKNIDPMAWTFSKEVVQRPQQSQNASKKQANSNGPTQKMCTTWNTFRKSGCHFENSNPGQSCIYLHLCSKCNAKGLKKNHKAWECTEPEPLRTSTTVSNVPNSIPVTSV